MLSPNSRLISGNNTTCRQRTAYVASGAALTAVVTGAVSLYGIAAESLGSAVLLDRGWTFYNIAESVTYGAIGGAIYGVLPAIYTSVKVMTKISDSLNGNPNESSSSNPCVKSLLNSVYVVGAFVFPGMIGYGIAHNEESFMNLGTAAAANATGSGILVLIAGGLIISYNCCVRCCTPAAERAAAARREASARRDEVNDIASHYFAQLAAHQDVRG